MLYSLTPCWNKNSYQHVRIQILYFVMALICFFDMPISLWLTVIIASFAATHGEYFPGNEFVKSCTVVQPNTYVLR